MLCFTPRAAGRPRARAASPAAPGTAATVAWSPPEGIGPHLSAPCSGLHSFLSQPCCPPDTPIPPTPVCQWLTLTSQPGLVSGLFRGVSCRLLWGGLGRLEASGAPLPPPAHPSRLLGPGGSPPSLCFCEPATSFILDTVFPTRLPQILSLMAKGLALSTFPSPLLVTTCFSWLPAAPLAARRFFPNLPPLLPPLPVPDPLQPQVPPRPPESLPPGSMVGKHVKGPDEGSETRLPKSVLGDPVTGSPHFARSLVSVNSSCYEFVKSHQTRRPSPRNTVPTLDLRIVTSLGPSSRRNLTGICTSLYRSSMALT